MMRVVHLAELSSNGGTTMCRAIGIAVMMLLIGGGLPGAQAAFDGPAATAHQRPPPKNNSRAKVGVMSGTTACGGTGCPATNGSIGRAINGRRMNRGYSEFRAARPRRHLFLPRRPGQLGTGALRPIWSAAVSLLAAKDGPSATRAGARHGRCAFAARVGRRTLEPTEFANT